MYLVKCLLIICLFNSNLLVFGNKIYKCCPENSELTELILENRREYECVEIAENQTRTDMFGYNFEGRDFNIHIPSCEYVELHYIDVEPFITTDGCVDLLNGRYIGLKCSNQINQEPVQFQIVRKCCPYGQAYDSEMLQCIPVTNYNDTNFNMIFRNSVTIFDQPGSLKCDQSQAVVEYNSENYDLHIRDNRLYIPKINFNSNDFCIELIIGDSGYEINNQVLIQTCQPRSVCDRIPCVRRCCNVGEHIQRVNGSSKCLPYPKGIKPTFHDVKLPLDEYNQTVFEPTEYGILLTLTCPRYILSPEDGDIHYFSHLDGSLHIADQTTFDNDRYCIENVRMGEDIQTRTFACFETLHQGKFQFYAVGLCISCVFLSITLLVYACLPKILLNQHGKILVCYVLTLLAAYIMLSIVQFHINSRLSYCTFAAYFIMFCFLSAFCWQSIMCFDIWWTFGSMRVAIGMRKPKELRRFIAYSIYAWGVPLLITSNILIINFYNLLPEIWLPAVKEGCFFASANWRGHFLFFLLPIGLHIATNAVLYILTAIHCSKVKSDIHRMQTQSDSDTHKKTRKFIADKAKLAMNVKLFIVMGVSWLLEIIATIFQEPEVLWYFTDAFNILQGVLVFIIFVLKKNILMAIKQKIGLESKVTKKEQGGATTTTGISTKTDGGLGIHDPYAKKIKKSTSTSTITASNTNLNNLNGKLL